MSKMGGVKREENGRGAWGPRFERGGTGIKSGLRSRAAGGSDTCKRPGRQGGAGDGSGSGGSVLPASRQGSPAAT